MADRHDRIREIFIAAVDLPAEQRGAFLDEACRDDAGLRTEMERLLEADGSTETFLHQVRDGAMPRFPAGALLADRFRVVRFIAAGGMGDVYEVDDVALNERLAMKTIRPELVGNENTLARFKREIQYAKRVTHPNVCRIHDFGVHRSGDSEVVFLTMELLEGETLARLLRREGRMSVADALPLVIQMAGALGAAHQSGIIHRDFKTSNLMLVGSKVMVTDFGLARPNLPGKEVTLTEAGKMVGTPAYMAPEQLTHGEITPATDIYALGLVMYEMLTGQRPFHGNTPLDSAWKRLSEAPTPPDRLVPDLDRRWSAVILRCLERDPSRRFQSSEEVVRALTGSSRVSRIPLATWLTAALAIVLIAIAIFIWRAGSVTAKPSPDAMRWYQEGINALRDGTYYKASTALERAVALAPRYTLAHAHLAEAWLELDLTDKARDEMLKAIPPGTAPKLAPEDEMGLEAIHLTLTADYQGAIGKYKGILKQNPSPDAYIDLGRAYEKGEDPKDALASYREAAQRAPQFAAAFLRSGVLYARAQNSDAARAAFDQAEALYRALSNTEGLIEVIYQRAVAANRGSRFQEAGELAQQAIAIARTAGNINQQITALLTLSSVQYNLGDPTRGQQSATEALDLARHDGLENLTTRGLVQVGNAALQKGDPQHAAEYFREALGYARRFKSVANEMRASFSLASALVQQGKAEEGLQVLGPPLEFYQKGGYRREAIQAQVILIRAKRLQGDYNGALLAAQDQLQNARQMNNQSMIALAEGAVGHALSSLQRFPEAVSHNRQYLAVAQAIGDKNGAAYAQLNLGSLLAQLGHYPEAAEALDRVVSPNPSGADTALRADVDLDKAQMDLSRLRTKEAILEARQALSAEKDTDSQVNGHCVLAIAAALTRKSKEALREADAALQLAQGSADTRGNALLASAMVRLEAGAARDALAAGLQAQEIFSRLGQPESEWRAWLVSARAAKAADDPAKAKEYAAAASAGLSALSETWPAADYKTYLARPDIQRYRKQLSHLQ